MCVPEILVMPAVGYLGIVVHQGLKGAPFWGGNVRSLIADSGDESMFNAFDT
jgi:hypothetical protein